MTTKPDGDGPVVLDMEVLATIAESSGIPARELLEFFAADARGNIAELRTAFQSGDRETVNRHAHSMKSSAASVGALRVAASARALELASKTSLAGEAVARCDELLAAFAALEIAVSEAMRDLPRT